MTDEIRAQFRNRGHIGDLGVDDVYEVTKMAGDRVRINGRSEVDIEIRERRNGGPIRWQVIVTDQEGRVATSNADEDLESAILNTPWENLDG